MAALRLRELSSMEACCCWGDSEEPALKTPDWRRETLDSLWVLGGLGLLSLEGGLALGGGKVALMDWGLGG